MARGRFEKIDPFTRFMAGWEPDTNGGCWLWTKSAIIPSPKRKYAQPQLVYPGGTKAARFSYEHFVGPIPKGMFVLHKCDVSYCVNPDHLYAGTHQQNMSDRAARGRTARGSICGRSRLSAEQARFIAAQKGAQSARSLAKQIGVHKNTIHNIWSGAFWGHETGIPKAATAPCD